MSVTYKIIGKMTEGDKMVMKKNCKIPVEGEYMQDYIKETTQLLVQRFLCIYICMCSCVCVCIYKYECKITCVNFNKAFVRKLKLFV